MEAPSMEAPPMEAPPMEAPPMEAPPMEAPPMEAHPLEAHPPVETTPTDEQLAAKVRKREANRLAQARCRANKRARQIAAAAVASVANATEDASLLRVFSSLQHTRILNKFNKC